MSKEKSDKRPNRREVAIAAREGEADRLARLLSMGASADSHNHHTSLASRKSALDLAIENEHARCVELLLSAGANPDLCVGAHNSAPLVKAATVRDTAMLSALLLAGASANVKDTVGDTALAVAASYGRLDAVVLLLANGASVNGRCENTETAAMLAADEGHSECLSALIEAGADLAIQTSDGKTAMDYAKGEVGEGAGGGGDESVALIEAALLSASLMTGGESSAVSPVALGRRL